MCGSIGLVVNTANIEKCSCKLHLVLRFIFYAQVGLAACSTLIVKLFQVVYILVYS